MAIMPATCYTDFLSMSMNIQWLRINKESFIDVEQEVEKLINIYNWPARGYFGSGVPVWMKDLYELLLLHNWAVVSCKRQDGFGCYLLTLEAPSAATRTVFVLEEDHWPGAVKT